MKKKRIYYVFLGLTIILALGVFFYSLTFFVINNKITLGDIRGNYNLGVQRLNLRVIAERIIAVSGSIYLLGHLTALVVFMKKNYRIPVKTILQYYFGEIAMMLLCAAPFIFMDKMWYKDYLFPIWNISIALLLILVVYTIFVFCKNKHGSV